MWELKSTFGAIFDRVIASSYLGQKTGLFSSVHADLFLMSETLVWDYETPHIFTSLECI